MTLLRSAVDAQVRETQPSLNFGQLVKLSVNGGGGATDRYAFIAFPVLNVLPVGAVIVTATLKLYLSGAWSGTNNLTIKRVTEPWKENKITWSNKPAVDALPAPTVAVVSGVDKQEVSFDVSGILQEVADGGKFFGFRVELTQDVNRFIRSAEDTDATLRPQLELEWSEAPEAPDRMTPDDQVVDSSTPRFRWRFTDRAGNTQQTAFQIQVDDSFDFVSPTHDSGKIVSDLTEYTPGSSVITDGQTRWWRVRVYDGTDFVSVWSEVAQFSRDDQGVLAITSPSGSTVPETTPPIVWTLTGETQESYQLDLYQNAVGAKSNLVYSSGRIPGTTNSHTIPAGLIKTGLPYIVTITSWDTENRYNAAGQVVSKAFTYARDGTPTQPSTLTAVPTVGSPEIVLTFTRATTPDYWALKVDGVEVEDRIEGADVFVSGTTYQIKYWGATPRVTHTFEVEAVVQTGGAGNPFQHSDNNPTATAKSSPIGIWLADQDDGLSIQILGRDSADVQLGENGATLGAIGASSQIRIVDTVRGYEGSISGLLLGATERDDFLTLKGRRKKLYLVFGDVAIPVTLEDGTAIPTPGPSGDAAYAVSFSFFQSGAPWPVKQLG